MLCTAAVHTQAPRARANRAVAGVHGKSVIAAAAAEGVKAAAARVKNTVLIKISLTTDCDAVGKHCRVAVRAFQSHVRQSGDDSARKRRTAASSAAEGEAILLLLLLLALAFRVFQPSNRASQSRAV